MKNFYATVLCALAVLPAFSVRTSVAQTQTGQQTSSANAAAPTWTIDQAVTCSVHDAWVLGGRNEQGFFAIVTALAGLAEQKRGVTLPDNEGAGRKFGDYIKSQAKTDRDQLLYAIVDRAVLLYGTKPVLATNK